MNASQGAFSSSQNHTLVQHWSGLSARSLLPKNQGVLSPGTVNLNHPVLACSSQCFSYLFIYPQDAISSHTGQCEDPAEPDSAPRSWHSCPEKEQRNNQHISCIREVSGVSTFSGPPHTKRSSFSHVSHICFHPQSSSSFPSQLLSLGTFSPSSHHSSPTPGRRQ